MLAAENRLTGADDFRRAVRTGARAGADHLVVHWLPSSSPAAARAGAGVRAGFVVSKAVGNAVVRNQVKRRLRHLTRDQLTELSGPGVLVVRALPSAATASAQELREQLSSSLSRAVRRASGDSTRRPERTGASR